MKLSSRKLSEFRNKRIGFVFQFHQLLPEFTAVENVMLPALISGASKGEAKKRAMELLDFMGLSERAGHKPAELSGRCRCPGFGKQACRHTGRRAVGQPGLEEQG